jgi:hypothetical protein
VGADLSHNGPLTELSHPLVTIGAFALSVARAFAVRPSATGQRQQYGPPEPALKVTRTFARFRMQIKNLIRSTGLVAALLCLWSAVWMAAALLSQSVDGSGDTQRLAARLNPFSADSQIRVHTAVQRQANDAARDATRRQRLREAALAPLWLALKLRPHSSVLWARLVRANLRANAPLEQIEFSTRKALLYGPYNASALVVGMEVLLTHGPKLDPEFRAQLEGVTRYLLASGPTGVLRLAASIDFYGIVPALITNNEKRNAYKNVQAQRSARAPLL